jgi:aldehyde:ferredoxin oxidoreductase
LPCADACDPQWPTAKGVKTIAALGAKELKTNRGMQELGELGTAGVVMGQQFAGGCRRATIRAASSTAEDISGERMAETILVDRDTCYACAVRCKREVEHTTPLRLPARTGRPGIRVDRHLWLLLRRARPDRGQPRQRALQRLGAGHHLRGARRSPGRWSATRPASSPPAQTDGLALRFGDADAMLAALEALAFRRGKLGELLAEGSARAAATLGKAAQDRLITVKGSEAPAHMPQVKRSMGLIYAVNPFRRGPPVERTRHLLRGEFRRTQPGLACGELGLTRPVPATDLGAEKVEFTLVTQYWTSLMDSINLCQFDWGATWQLYGPVTAPQIVNAVTGWDTDIRELMEVGARRVNLMKVFNAREGFTRDDDKLPRRLHEPLTGGVSDGMRVSEEEIEWAKDLYYRMAGWDVETGNPTPERLEELGIGWAALHLPA